MKKDVEQEIKNAVESWESRDTDLGFDKEMVWGMIDHPAKENRFRISWFKIAAILLLLIVVAGWGRSVYIIDRLQQSKVAMVGQVQTLGEEIEQFRNNKNKNNSAVAVRVDTVVKVIEVKEESRFVDKDYQSLMNQYQELLLQHNQLKNKLTASNQQYQILQDSVFLLALNLQYYINQESSNFALSQGDINLQVDDEALTALSEQSAELVTTKAVVKNGLKLVLFNKSESSRSKAPKKRGIRF